MEYFVVYRPGQPDTWMITSSKGFFDIALTPLQALVMIGRDIESSTEDGGQSEFSVRWINTPDGFVSPDPEELGEISPEPELTN